MTATRYSNDAVGDNIFSDIQKHGRIGFTRSTALTLMY